MRVVGTASQPLELPMYKLRILPTLPVILFCFGSSLYAQTSLQAQLVLRPVTRDDISTYKLASTTQVSPGLSTVGLGQPIYLDMLVNKAIPADQIAGVTWTLTGKPANSNAVLADSPLGSNVLPFEPADIAASRVAGRQMLKPDVPGMYAITATVTTVGAGTATLKTAVVGGTYVGVKACTTCHDGRLLKDKVTPWAATGHAALFKLGITGVASDHYGANCIACHTVGYDAAPGVNNNGFAQVAKKLNWTFPTTLNASTWDSIPKDLQNLGSIQCENCHGPGSEHATNGGNSLLISKNILSGTCGQCHGAMTHHSKMGEWNNSRHSIAVNESGPGREACVGCHTGAGFIAKMKGAPADTSYTAINCTTCHEPHGDNTGTAGHLVRPSSVTLADGTKIEEGGKGMLCMNCHQARVNAEKYVATTAGSARFGPHHGPQADMLAGTNAITYGKNIPSSAHGSIAEDACVTCHMQAVAETAPGFAQAGGHTFRMATAGDAKNQPIELVAACKSCHGKHVDGFNFTLFDYDGDGTIDGVQTEVQHLLDKLSSMLPPNDKPKTALTIDSTWTPKQLKAAFNWTYVTEDRSKGIHNTAYTVGILKASIADLSSK